MGKEALLGPCFFLIPSGAAHGGVYLIFFERIQKRDCLQSIPAGIYPGLLPYPSGIYTLLYGPDNQLHTKCLHQPIPKINGLGKVMPSIDMDKRKRNFGRKESFFGQMSRNNAVFSS